MSKRHKAAKAPKALEPEAPAADPTPAPAAAEAASEEPKASEPDAKYGPREDGLVWVRAIAANTSGGLHREPGDVFLAREDDAASLVERGQAEKV